MECFDGCPKGQGSKKGGIFYAHAFTLIYYENQVDRAVLGTGRRKAKIEALIIQSGGIGRKQDYFPTTGVHINALVCQ